MSNRFLQRSSPTFRPGRMTIGERKATIERLRSEEHTSELQSQSNLVCRLLLEKKTVLAGCPLILLPRFQITEVLEAIQKYRVTIFSGIPAMFMKLSESPKVGRYDLRSLPVCLSGASPLRAEVQDRFRRLIGVEISEGYGLTEASPVTHCNPVYGAHPEGSIGVPFPDTDVRLVDLDSGERAVPAGGLGELVVRGPQVMQGYWNKPSENRSVLRDGGLYTGDIAPEGARGWFYLGERERGMVK